MPIDAKGQIMYHQAVAPSQICYQADPPVCNRCDQEITRANFGWAYTITEGQSPEQYECIECRSCTMIRASGAPLLTFLQRHNLAETSPVEPVLDEAIL
jgi:hypothetical protein